MGFIKASIKNNGDTKFRMNAKPEEALTLLLCIFENIVQKLIECKGMSSTEARQFLIEILRGGESHGKTQNEF